MTLNELQPQAQTHSKSGAITNMPRLLSTPPQTPVGGFFVSYAALQNSKNPEQHGLGLTALPKGLVNLSSSWVASSHQPED